MPRPHAAQLKERLPCIALDNADAMQVVERVASDQNLLVAMRTRRSMVLMPVKRPSFLSCIAPGFAAPTGAAHAPLAGGAGITAELVPDEGGEGLALSVAMAHTKEGEAFVASLRKQLAEQGGSTPSASSHAGPAGTPVASSHFKMEAQAYYCFSKMLYDVREEPGREAATFMQGFSDTLATLNPTAVSTAMSDCVAGIDRLCRLIEKHIALADNSPSSARRFGVPSAADLQPWLRGSVERCVFSRVGAPLWRLYEERCSADDARYADKAGRLRAFGDRTLLDALEVRAELRGVAQELRTPRRLSAHSGGRAGRSEEEVRLVKMDDQDPMNSQRTRSTVASASDQAQSRFMLGTATSPYERASAALSQIELLFTKGHPCTPRELLEALTLSQLEMKTCALEASGGQSELYSMDDVMPVFIYVLVRSSLASPFACARLMGDALTQDERSEAEGRAVLLLESAARHVADDWDISTLQEVPQVH